MGTLERAVSQLNSARILRRADCCPGLGQVLIDGNSAGGKRSAFESRRQAQDVGMGETDSPSAVAQTMDVFECLTIGQAGTRPANLGDVGVTKDLKCSSS